MQNLHTILVPLGFLAAVGWVAWLIAQIVQKRLAAQRNLRQQLLDKLTTPQEFAAWLDVDEGRRLLDALSMKSRNPLDRILSSIQVGLLSSLLGICSLVVSVIAGTARDWFLFGGMFALTVGAGLLLSAAIVRHMRKVWGVDDAKNR